MMSKRKILKGISEQISNKYFDFADTQLDCFMTEELKQSVMAKLTKEICVLSQIKETLEKILI